MKQGLTFLDLFAGAGGFALGFSKAGFQCMGVIENDSSASETYSINFSHHKTLPLCRLGPADGNILSISEEEIKRGLKQAGVKQLDLLLGGPPCQGFSKVGRGKLDHLAKKKGAFKNDPRNKLYLKYLEILRWARPRIFLFENVVGILHLQGKNVAEEICSLAEMAGYQVRCTILNAAWFGVPQIRERVFILGVRNDLPFEPSFPRPSYFATLRKGHVSGADLRGDFFRNSKWFLKTENPSKCSPARTVKEALGDLPPFLDHLTVPGYRAIRGNIEPLSYRPGRPNAYASLMRKWNGKSASSTVIDHFCRHTPRDYEIFAKMKPGDKYPRAVEIAEERYSEARKRFRSGLLKHRPRRRDFVPPYNTEAFEEKWWKLIPSRPSWTLTAHLGKDCYSHIHYDTQSRAITIREAARLQSFPDDFVFMGSMGDCFRQIGNAVPPLLSHALAKHIRSLLRQLA